MKSFFKSLVYLEQKILFEGTYTGTDGELKKYDVDTKEVLNSLIAYIEKCEFSKSVNTKFICKHFRLKTADLTQKWNDIAEEEKTEDAFRSQISLLSNQLTQIFGSDIERVFLTEDKAGIINIMDVLDMLDNYPLSSFDYFIGEVIDTANESSFDREYDVSELTQEIEVLKPYLKRSVWGKLDSLDSSKLVYLVAVLKQPYLYTKERRVNHKKIELLRALSTEPKGDESRFYRMLKKMAEIPNNYERKHVNVQQVNRALFVQTPKGFKDYINRKQISNLDIQEALRLFEAGVSL